MTIGVSCSNGDDRIVGHKSTQETIQSSRIRTMVRHFYQVCDVVSSESAVASWLTDGASSGVVGVALLSHPASDKVIDRANSIAKIRIIFVRFIFFLPVIMCVCISLQHDNSKQAVHHNGLIQYQLCQDKDFLH